MTARPSRTKRLLQLGALAGSLLAGARAGEVEVLHYWTSGGEARSVAALKAQLEKQGHAWRDFVVVGGGGESAMSVLKARVQSGNAPAAAQIKGATIQQWAREGLLTQLDDIASRDRWDSLLPPVVADAMKFQGKYVAVPVNVHRVNWLWANPDALKKAGARLPTNWDEFFVAADRLKAAGLIPVAHGGQSWQEFTLFESVVLGIGGADFYRRALVQLDPPTLYGETMKQALTTFRRIKDYTDRDAPGRDWNEATAMVIRGEAGMQLMGDWAKGEFVAAGKVPGKDFLCVAAPGTAKAYTFNIDSFAMFQVQGEERIRAQKDLATAILSPEFQEVFNLNKGSIPVRMAMNLARFDDCARLSASDFVSTGRSGTLVPSIAHGMAVAPALQDMLQEIVSQFWNNDRISVDQATRRLAAAARTR
ncbi:ABC transporter substrate-binding protein [Leptothrix sp. BB-4]